MSQFAHNFWRIFSAHAETIPNVEAILAPGRKALRFGEFARHLLAVKETLNSYGIGRGDRVASALPRGSETAVCAVAATACSTYIPLNPDLTEEEFSRYLSRIRPKAVIVPAGSGEAARQAANLHGIMIIELLPDAKGPAGSFTLEQGTAGLCHLPQWNRADDIAFILPTSGTTSEQKLIPTKQHHMLALSQAAQKHFNLGPSDRCLHIMPMFHGHGLESSLLVPLIIGSGVICPEVFDIPSFFDCVKQFEPTWYSAGYSHHGAILNQIDDYRTIANNSTFRFIRSGSGRLDPRVNLGLEDAFGAPVIERYGMSEATSLTANPLPPAIRKPGTVGLPLTGEIRIVDETGATLGANCDGEILVRGPTVFEGYLDDPAATAAAFVDGWFITGDLGRLDDDGYLTIVGRVKEMINRGGEKILPREIEEVLTAHPDILEAVVFPIPHPTLGEIVGAAIIPEPGMSPPGRELSQFMRARLAPFKVPNAFKIVEEMPKGPTGKIQRNLLTEAFVASRKREAVRKILRPAEATLLS